MNIFPALRVKLDVFHLPARGVVPSITNKLRPVSVAMVVPLGAFVRKLSMKTVFDTFDSSHIRVSKTPWKNIFFYRKKNVYFRICVFSQLEIFQFDYSHYT